MLQSFDASTSIVFQDAPGPASDSNATGQHWIASSGRPGERMHSQCNRRILLERCAVQRADCGMRTAKDSRGLRWSRKGRKRVAQSPRHGYGAEVQVRVSIQALQWACRDWPGGVWGRQPVWHRSAPALVAAIDKRKKVQPGNRRYRYLASSAAAAPCKPETTGLSSSLRLWLCFAQ